MVHPKRKKASVSRKKTPKASKPSGDLLVENHGEIEKGTEEKGAQAIFNEVEDYAILMLDPKGIITSWNKGAEKIKGYSANEIIGKNYRIFYTTEDKKQNLPEKFLEQAKHNGRTHYEGWRVKKDGTRFWGSMTITALHNKAGQLTGYLKLTWDLTERKIVEDNYSNFIEELKITNEELKASELRYHKMFSEVVDYAIILLDQEGKILDWNKGAEKVKGYSAKEIIGKNFKLFYPKEEKESRMPERLLEQAIKKGSVIHEGWRIRKDGKRFWGNITITALHDDTGALIGFSKLTRDLTEKKIAEDRHAIFMEELQQANEHLKASEERYHKMVEEVQDYAIIMLDPEGNIQNWNAGAEFIKGYKTKDIVGKNFNLFYTKEDRANKLPEKLLSQAKKEGKVSHEGWRVRKDGTCFWGSVVITALHKTDGSLLGFSKVTRDLTERRKAEEALKSSAAQLDLKNKTLERVNEELSSFTYVASHDLKEPLRKIQTYTARIKAVDFAPDKSKEYVEKIESSALRMQNLIENLLSYSQLSNDTSSPTKVDLNAILNAVKSDLEIAIHEKQAIIRADRLPTITGVEYQMHQLFLNLISNAIKFSSVNQSPDVEIKAQVIKGPDMPGGFPQSNKYHHISIKDNGIGFSPEFADKIFNAFERLHAKDIFSGSGIGLAIVKRIIKNHNGVISAESVPGEGATFHVYLPF